MEKFTNPELLEFLCDDNYDDVLQGGPLASSEADDLFGED